MKFQHTCVSIENLHKCEGWKFNLFSFHTSKWLSGQLFYWLSMVFQCHNLFTWWRGQVGAILLPSYASSNWLCFRGCSPCNMSKYVDFSVPGLQSGSPALGVRIKIRILAVFFNQRYELGPKATISTCSQVGLIMLSGELSDSVDSHSLCFQC